MSTYIELSEFYGAPIVDTFDTFGEWIDGGASEAILNAVSGQFVVSGTGVDLFTARKVEADTEALAVAGTTVLFAKTFPLNAASGAVACQGTAAGLVATEPLRWQ